jgi:alpha-amylase
MFKGIWVMVDVVVNHMGAGDISSFGPAPLNQQSGYHSACDIDYNNAWSIENCQIAGLPDVNTQDSNIRSMFSQWIKWFVQEYSFDGVRIDTVKHVEKDFWSGFVSAAGVYTIGEVWNGDPEYLAG